VNQSLCSAALKGFQAPHRRSGGLATDETRRTMGLRSITPRSLGQSRITDSARLQGMGESLRNRLGWSADRGLSPLRPMKPALHGAAGLSIPQPRLAGDRSRSRGSLASGLGLASRFRFGPLSIAWDRRTVKRSAGGAGRPAGRRPASKRNPAGVRDSSTASGNLSNCSWGHRVYEGQQGEAWGHFQGQENLICMSRHFV
jgi:hypothetical protein